MDDYRDENKINGMVIGVERTTTLLTRKLFVNPNSNIQKQAQGTGPVDSMERCHAVGEQWWGQDKCGQAPLKSQHSLLDGGEGLLDHLPTHLRYRYASDFRLADNRFHFGRVAATTKGRESCWERWAAYGAPVGVNPYPQDTLFTI
jgi:hypothetical protein